MPEALFSGIHQICIPAFPFDPPTQSGTLYVVTSRYTVVATSHTQAYLVTLPNNWKIETVYASVCTCAIHSVYHEW